MEHTPVDRVAQLEEQVSRLTSLVEGLRAEGPAGLPAVSGDGRAPRSRRQLLKLAGAAAAGAAGVAIAGRSVKDAYAVTTDTNFVATGTTTTGFDSSGGNFSNGVWAKGSNNGIAAQGGNLAGYFLGGTRASLWLQPKGFAGAPTSVNHWQGDLLVDSNGVIWMCTAGDGTTLGTFAPQQQGGIDNAIYTTVSNKQYVLGASNGVAWADMDPTLLSLTITPTFNGRAILYANADLWTNTPYLNQDIAITVNGTVHSWKESGGPGTYSPNAAFIHAVFGDFFAGTTYTVKLQWKANKAATATQIIVAGAGPIPAGSASYSPTRLSVQLINI
jgi:hypothetical protein